MKQRALGLLIAFIGTLVVTPDAALLRVQAEAGGSAAVITVWRYVMSFFLGTAAAIIAHGGVGAVVESIRPAPLHVVGASCIMLCTNVGFTISLLKVDPAKALLLISLNPLWSALLGYFILGDKLPMRTVVAQVVSLVAMLVMFAPNMLALLTRSEHEAEEEEAQSAADNGASELLDLIPLVTGMAQAALLIFVRSASIRIPECTMDFVPALSALFTVAFAVAIAKLDGNADGSQWSLSSLHTGLQPQFWVSLFGCGLGVAGYNLACTVAPRYLTGAEVSLVLLFESVGGPLWVFVGFGDVPSPWTLASGALLIGALVGHEIAAMYDPEDVDDWGSPGAPGLISSPRGGNMSSMPLSPAFRPGSSPLPSYPPRLSSSPLSLGAVRQNYGVPLLVATLSPERRGANSMAARMAGRPAVPAPARGRSYEPPPGVSRRNST